MSELVSYFIQAKGFKDDKEKEEFKELARKFENEVEIYEWQTDKIVEVEVAHGWRGGGMSCEEIVREHFREWLKKHKHVKLYVEITYLEHAPTESFEIDYEEDEILEVDA